MFPFFKRKVLLIMLLQVNIKDLIIFSAQTPGLSKNTKVLALKKWKIKYENEFFQQKDCDNQYHWPFLSINWNYQKVTNPFKEQIYGS